MREGTSTALVRDEARPCSLSMHCLLVEAMLHCVAWWNAITVVHS